jgi:hypothetical protein
MPSSPIRAWAWRCRPPKGLESIKSYRDIFGGPEASFGPDKHQGASSSFLAVVKGGRWVRLTDPLTY